jgi:hypothetical protein
MFCDLAFVTSTDLRIPSLHDKLKTKLRECAYTMTFTWDSSNQQKNNMIVENSKRVLCTTGGWVSLITNECVAEGKVGYFEVVYHNCNENYGCRAFIAVVPGESHGYEALGYFGTGDGKGIYLGGMSRYYNDNGVFTHDNEEFKGVTLERNPRVGVFVDMRLHKNGKAYLVVDGTIKGLMYDKLEGPVYPGVSLDIITSTATIVDYAIIPYDWLNLDLKAIGYASSTRTSKLSSNVRS